MATKIHKCVISSHSWRAWKSLVKDSGRMTTTKPQTRLTAANLHLQHRHHLPVISTNTAKQDRHLKNTLRVGASEGGVAVVVADEEGDEGIQEPVVSAMVLQANEDPVWTWYPHPHISTLSIILYASDSSEYVLYILY